MAQNILQPASLSGTRENFTKLAKHPLKPNMDTFFVVEEIFIDDLLPGRKRHYPCFKVTKEHQAEYRTLAEAEASLKQSVTDRKQGRKYVYCYYIRELCMSSYYRKDPKAFISCRLYDNHGNLLDRSYYAAGLPSVLHYYNIFRGRDESMLRFKDGDIVEWYHPEGFVTLGILVDNWAPTPEDCWHSWQEEMKVAKADLEKSGMDRDPSDFEVVEGYSWDLSDDAFTVLDGGIASKRLGRKDNTITIGHNLCLFAPRYKVPDSTQRRLKKLYDKYMEQQKKLISA